MGHYHFSKSGSSSRLVLAGEPESRAVLEPVGTSLKGAGKRYLCTACNPERGFGSAGVLVNHFNRIHSELKKNKNSWRSHSRVETAET